MVNEGSRGASRGETGPVTMFGPDFPFGFDDWITHPAGLGSIPAGRHGEEVAVVGAGISGLVAAYELMRLGLKPVVYEASRMGGRLRSQAFEGADGVVAELGGMRFPVSSTSFYHYVDMLGLQTRPFPNPLTEAAGSTVIDLEGLTHYARTLHDLPPLFTEVADAWAQALEDVRYSAIQNAIRARDVSTLKSLWNDLVPRWDDRTFYDFVASSKAFSSLSFHHREVFGHVGFGTGGWDSDYPNSMLEIFRVVMTNCDENQRLVVGGAEQVPRGIWRHRASGLAHWPAGTSLASLHRGAPKAGVARIAREGDGQLAILSRHPAGHHVIGPWLIEPMQALNRHQAPALRTRNGAQAIELHFGAFGVSVKPHQHRRRLQIRRPNEIAAMRRRFHATLDH